MNIGIPMAISVLSILPFIFSSKSEEENKQNNKSIDHFKICYLLFLGLAILALIIFISIQVMAYNTPSRALLLCSVLLIACADRLIDLSALITAIKASLANTLHYFVLVLCLIPALWQLMLFIIPSNISDQLNIMTAVQLVLMLSALILSVIKRPAKAIPTLTK
jgi:hypothetical protein